MTSGGKVISTGDITSGAKVISTGDITAGANITGAGSLAAHTATPIPAGGTAGMGVLDVCDRELRPLLRRGSPSPLGGPGSVYMRSDGTTTNDRMYVNTDGATTWTAVNTVT